MRTSFFFVAFPFFFSADADLAAGAPPAAADGPEPGDKSKLDEIRAKASPQVANERGALKAAGAEMNAAALAEAKESIGIQNALEVVKFGVAVADAIDKAKADGKIDFADAPLLFPVAPLVVPMIDGIGQVPKELGDLDQAELDVLMAEAGKILGGDGAKTVKRVRAALKFAHAGYELYEAFKA